MTDVFQKLIGEKDGKGGGPLRITRRIDAPLFAGEGEQMYYRTCIASQFCEASFCGSTIEVACNDGVDEAPPESVLFLEALLPDSLDLFVVALE